MNNYREYMEAAIAITESAGPIALEYFRRQIAIDDKRSRNEFDPVTEADRRIETHIREQLARRFPGHGVCGEEHQNVQGNSDYNWIIDPIDGTRAFISGMPAWGIMLGLRELDAPRVGVVHQPFTGETFAGDRDTSWLRHRDTNSRMKTSACNRLDDATLYCTHPSIFPSVEEFEAFQRVADASRLMRYGGDCYAYCLLALGTVDLVIESGLEAYDIQPLIPIIEGAGGIVSDRQGATITAGGFVVAAATKELHQQALARLNE